MIKIQSILMSIQAEHNANIEAFKKFLELRKNIPKCELPFKVYTYESGKNGRHKVTNEWICDYIIGHCDSSNADIAEQQGCVKREFIFDYSKGKEVFGLHISNLKIYKEPMALDWFSRPTGCDLYKTHQCPICCFDCEVKRPPQSWCYLR